MRLPRPPAHIRDPLILLALLGLWAALAPGRSATAQRPAAPVRPPAPAAGAGAGAGAGTRPRLSPGPESAAANRAALQAALDAARPFDRVVVPRGTWPLDRPLWHDRDLVTLAGEPGA